MPLWARLVVLVGGLKVAFGMAVFLSGQTIRTVPPPVPEWVYAALATAFALLGCLLVVGNRQDTRAAWLGGMFVLMASPLVPSVNSYTNPWPWPAWITYLRPEALQPAFVWRFLGEFPSPLAGTGARVAKWCAAVSLAVGSWCLAMNLSLAWWPLST